MGFFYLTEAATGLSQVINPYYLHSVTPTRTFIPALPRPTHTSVTTACELKGRLFIYSKFQATPVFEEDNRARKYIPLVHLRNSQPKGTRLIMSDHWDQRIGFRYQRRKAGDFDKLRFAMEVNYSLQTASAFLLKRYRRIIPGVKLMQSTFFHFKSTLCQVKHSPEENNTRRNQKAYHGWFWWKLTSVTEVH